jgi:hypothetical protein
MIYIVILIFVAICAFLPDILVWSVSKFVDKANRKEMNNERIVQIEYEEKDEFWGDKNGKSIKKK